MEQDEHEVVAGFQVVSLSKCKVAKVRNKKQENADCEKKLLMHIFRVDDEVLLYDFDGEYDGIYFLLFLGAANS